MVLLLLSPTVGDYYLVRGANFSKELIATAVSENGIVTFSTDVTGADSITKLAHIKGSQITDQLLIGINPDTITGIPFGFPTIDKFINGATDGYIYTLCGHNGHCKSLFSQVVMLNMAIWLKKQKDDYPNGIITLNSTL